MPVGWVILDATPLPLTIRGDEGRDRVALVDVVVGRMSKRLLSITNSSSLQDPDDGTTPIAGSQSSCIS